ncbi:cell wall-binding repeat-containing protein [Eggerthellaceae bacterium PR-HUZ602407-17]
MFRSITPSLIRRLKIACGIVALCVFFGSIISNGTVKTAYADEGANSIYVEDLKTRCGSSIYPETRLADLWLNDEDSNNEDLKTWFPGYELVEGSNFSPDLPEELQDGNINICETPVDNVQNGEGDPYFDESTNYALNKVEESGVFDDYPWTFQLLPYYEDIKTLHYYLSNNESKQLIRTDEVLEALKKSKASKPLTIVLEGTAPASITPALEKLINTEGCILSDNTRLSTSLSKHAVLSAKLLGTYPFEKKDMWEIKAPLSSKDLTDVILACDKADKPLQFVNSKIDKVKNKYNFDYVLPIFLAPDKKTATISEEGMQFIKKYHTVHDRSASISNDANTDAYTIESNVIKFKRRYSNYSSWLVLGALENADCHIKVRFAEKSKCVEAPSDFTTAQVNKPYNTTITYQAFGLDTDDNIVLNTQKLGSDLKATINVDTKSVTVQGTPVNSKSRKLILEIHNKDGHVVGMPTEVDLEIAPAPAITLKDPGDIALTQYCQYEIIRELDKANLDGTQIIVSPEKENGLTAKISNGSLIITGTPRKAETVTFKLSAQQGQTERAHLDVPIVINACSDIEQQYLTTIPEQKPEVIENGIAALGNLKFSKLHDGIYKIPLRILNEGYKYNSIDFQNIPAEKLSMADATITEHTATLTVIDGIYYVDFCLERRHAGPIVCGLSGLELYPHYEFQFGVRKPAYESGQTITIFKQDKVSDQGAIAPIHFIMNNNMKQTGIAAVKVHVPAMGENTPAALLAFDINHITPLTVYKMKEVTPAPAPVFTLTGEISGAQAGKELSAELSYTLENADGYTVIATLEGEAKDGLTATVDTVSKKVTLKGTPTKAGEVTVKVSATKQGAMSLEQTKKFTVAAAPEPALTLTGDVKGAQVGKELNVELSFTNANMPEDTTFEPTLAGDGSANLTAKVSEDKTKVILSGTPSKAGAVTVTLNAKKADATIKTATKEFNVAAASAPVPPVPAPEPPSPAPAPEPSPEPQPGKETPIPSFDQATKRIAGNTAEDTMQQIVQTAFPDPVDKVVLATSESYWDALSANSLAGSLNAPVLLTHHDVLPAQTIAELKRLHTSKVVVCGGENAISNDVVAQLKGLNIEVERVAGQMASDTANDIAQKLAKSDTAVVATSWGYEDALSAASYAYAQKAPIFLANYNSATLDASSIQTMKDKGVKKVYIVGGTSVVSPEVEAQLQEAGITVERIAGQTAYDTSAKLATKLISLGMSANNMAIATGWGYTDALAGAALCGKQNSVMVLADNTNQTAINEVVAANKHSIQNYYIFGGTSVVGDGATDVLKGVFTGKDAE